MENNKLVPLSAPNQHSIKLISCLELLTSDEAKPKAKAKMELLAISRDLMPAGKPNFLEIRKYTPITDLVKSYGEGTMLKLLFVLIKDFCASINVVRNMNEDQMIESASMLLNECENFRMEDYTIMFSMAKKGELYKIFDHLDIQVITEIMNAYYENRGIAGKLAATAEVNMLDSLGVNDRVKKDGADLDDGIMGLSGAFENLKDLLKQQ